MNRHAYLHTHRCTTHTHMYKIIIQEPDMTQRHIQNLASGTDTGWGQGLGELERENKCREFSAWCGRSRNRLWERVTCEQLGFHSLCLTLLLPSTLSCVF